MMLILACSGPAKKQLYVTRLLILTIQRDFELSAIVQRQSVQVLLESTGLMHFLQEYLNTMVPTGEMRRNLGLFKFY